MNEAAADQLDDKALDLIFRAARTHSKWLNKPVPDALLQQAFELARMGPTSGNCQPLRILFVRGAEAKKKFEPCLSDGNRAKTECRTQHFSSGYTERHETSNQIDRTVPSVRLDPDGSLN